MDVVPIHTYVHFISFNPDLPLGYGYETCKNLGCTQTNITYRIAYLHIRHSQSLDYISPSYLHTNKATYIVK